MSTLASSTSRSPRTRFSSGRGGAGRRAPPADPEADAEDWPRPRRIPSLLTGLTVALGTTVLGSATALADEQDTVNEHASSTPGEDRPPAARIPSEEDAMHSSRSSVITTEPYESADEGEEGVWSGNYRRRFSSQASGQLSTILDNSPRIVTADRLEEPSSTHKPSISLKLAFGDDPQPEVAQPDAQLLPASPPRSVKQLVREGRRQSNLSDRDFTALDDKRLSIRATERLDDGLGISLEVFDAPEQDGGLSSYTPSVRPTLPRSMSSTGSARTLHSKAYKEFEVLVPTRSGSLNQIDEAARAWKSPQLDSPAPCPQLGTPAILRVRTSEASLQTPSKGSTDSKPALLGGSPATSPSLRKVTSSPVAYERHEMSLSPSPSGLTRSSSQSLRKRLSMRADSPKLKESKSVDSGSSSLASRSSKRLSGLFSLGRSASKDDLASVARSGTEEQPVRRRTVNGLLQQGKEAVTPSKSLQKRVSIKRSPSSQLGASPISAIPENSRPSASRPVSRGSSRPSSMVASSTTSPRSSMASSNDFLTTSGSATSEPPPPASPTAQEPLARNAAIGASPFMARTWRSMLDPATYEDLSREHGAVEMRRQEVIWELCETERSFVSGLRSVIRIFALPLRTPLGSWLPGVPIPVSRLLDWLEDIVYLHSQISTALEQARQDAPDSLVLAFAGVFLPFVARLEVHQPYLVRFEAVTRAIDEMAAEPESDFGEFVRWKSSLPECAGLSLSSFLLKPVQRLMKYPLFFRVSRDPLTRCLSAWLIS